MKTKSNILTLIILCSLLFILISSASAAEKINTTVEDNAVESNLNSYENNLSSYNDEKISSGTEYTFNDLADKISQTPDGGELNLTQGDVYINTDSYSSAGIVISKSITINGNGAIIDGNRVGKIFNINKNVVLKNINFINAYSTSDGGGAIGASNCNLDISDCTFINNTLAGSWASGAAISLGTGNLKIDNSYFENNYASGIGGAIYVDGGYTINNCSFVRNTAKNGGGAIMSVYNSNFPEMYAINCSFIGNNVQQSHGGTAMCINKGLSKFRSFINCNFISQTITLYNENGQGQWAAQGYSSVNLINNWWGSNSGNSYESDYLMAKSEFVNLTDDVFYFKTVFYKKTDSTQTPVNVTWTRPVTGTNIYGDTSNAYIFEDDLSSVISYNVDSQQLTLTNPYSLTALNDLINAAIDTVNLTHDYKYYSGDSVIRLNTKSLILNGNNHMIDGKNSGIRCFDINPSSTPTFTFNNIAFVNFTHNGLGAAIHHNAGGAMTINYCNFTNCRSTYTGGDKGGGCY